MTKVSYKFHTVVRRHGFALKFSCSVVIGNYFGKVATKHATFYVEYFIHSFEKLISTRQEWFNLTALVVPGSLSKALGVEQFPKGTQVQNKSQGGYCLDRNSLTNGRVGLTPGKPVSGPGVRGWAHRFDWKLHCSPLLGDCLGICSVSAVQPRPQNFNNKTLIVSSQ